MVHILIWGLRALFGVAKPTNSPPVATGLAKPALL